MSDDVNDGTSDEERPRGGGETMGIRAILTIRDEEIHVVRRPENAHLDQKPDAEPDPA